VTAWAEWYQSPFVQSSTGRVYKHLTGMCRAGFAHKASMFGVLREGNGKHSPLDIPGPILVSDQQ
jgi:hypothetical protein